MADGPAGEGFSREIARIVVSRQQIALRVEQLAARIAERYADAELTIVAALTGSVIFLADLIRKLAIPMRLVLVPIRSYPGQATKSQGPVLALPIPADLAGKEVLIVDDILDSGQTLTLLLERIRDAEPASVCSCVLLNKDRPDLPNRVEPDYFGFRVPNEFLVGYGLDFDHRYRNLPDVCVLRQHARPDTRGLPAEGPDE